MVFFTNSINAYCTHSSRRITCF